ncbi:hypothetical protein [Chrysiogenes arsenatis]|uniref:hypothetical protein n=1 Tax=Chrysiogenes arsenatis TaxID=309797 RepID=UPI0004033D6C|nr:hypothetical protein [Chrysiogenes arsenatis]
MRIRYYWRCSALVAVLLLIIVGCGGGGGSSWVSDSSTGGTTGALPSGTTVTLSGIVVDPPIRNAAVWLRHNSDHTLASFCGVGGNQSCTTWSDEAGRFTFIFPRTIDMSAYHLSTLGGVDTVYGTSFESITLKSPLRPYAGSLDTVIISPVTTIMQSLSETITDIPTLQARTRHVLGLPAHVDPLSDPTHSSELLKVAYLLVRIASEQSAQGGGTEILSDLGNALRTQILLESNGTLVAAALQGIDAAVVARAYATAEQLKNVTQFSGSATMKQIARTNTLQLLHNALEGLLDNYPAAELAPAYIANVSRLYDAIETIATGIDIPVDTFRVMQLARYITYITFNVNGLDSTYFADYNSYLNDEVFAAQLTALSSSNTFATEREAIRLLASEGRIHLSRFPVHPDLMPGDDNARRAAYYFSSDLDRNMVARTLINRVRDDSVNDDIYLSIVASYATAGQHQRAENLVRSSIIGSANRAKGYRLIGQALRLSDSAAALTYLQEAESLFWAEGTLTDFLISELIELSKNYSQIARLDEAHALRNQLWHAIDNTPSFNQTAKWTRWARIANGQRDFAAQLATEGALPEALQALDYYFTLIHQLSPLAGPNYNSHISSTVQAVAIYRTLAEQGADRNTMKQKILDAFTQLEVWRNATTGTTWQGATGYGLLAGHLYWAGDTTSATDILTLLTPAGRAAAIRGILIAKGSTEGFQSAQTFYNDDTIKGQLTFDEIVSSWSYFNSTAQGIASHARLSGDFALAEAALDYLATQIEQVRQQTELTPHELITEFSHLLSNRYLEKGYLKLAKEYRLIGRPEKSDAILDSAEAYLDTLPHSFARSKAYAAVGAQHVALNHTARARTLFSKAHQTIEGLEPLYAANFIIGQANDHLLVGDTLHITDTLLSRATESARAMNSDNNQVVALRHIANLYQHTPQAEKSQELLALAYDYAQTIVLESVKIAAYENIAQAFAELDLIEAGYRAAWEIFSMSTERNRALKQLAHAVTTRDAFPSCAVAFVDTDKDGKPDFFLPWATPAHIAACGLELDDDSDGDGKPDANDPTPLYADPGKYE